MQPIQLALPFTGSWLVQNSPARRVPSHGTHLLATAYAIDFVAVDPRGRTAPSTSWRTALATEPPELFFGFGAPILAPIAGQVVMVHDAEVDHAARRSQLTLLAYMAGQAGRLRQGLGAIGGNYILIETARAVVGLMHLRRGSARVSVGQRVVVGEHLADCGNSGNSTQPHLHLQAMDDADATTARALPILFSRFTEQRGGTSAQRENALPAERSIVSPPST